MGHTLDTIGHYGHYVADAAAAATGNAWAIPAIEGINSGGQTLAKGGGFGDALKSAAFSAGGSYLGSNLGAAMFPGAGNVGGALSNSMGTSALGSFVGNSIPSEIANIGLGSALGGYAGNTIGNQLGKYQPPSSGAPAMAGNAPFKPTQASQMQLPASLASMSTLNPQQQVSGLANQGTYGGGLGPQEQDYFLNMENRKLVDPQGHVSPMGSLSPIEQSYLQQLGLSGYDNSTSLLEAMKKRQPS